MKYSETTYYQTSPTYDNLICTIIFRTNINSNRYKMSAIFKIHRSYFEKGYLQASRTSMTYSLYKNNDLYYASSEGHYDYMPIIYEMRQEPVFPKCLILDWILQLDIKHNKEKQEIKEIIREFKAFNMKPINDSLGEKAFRFFGL